MRSFLTGSKSRQSLDAQAELVLKSMAPSFTSTSGSQSRPRKLYPAFYSELRSHVKEVLQMQTNFCQLVSAIANTNTVPADDRHCSKDKDVAIIGQHDIKSTKSTE